MMTTCFPLGQFGHPPYELLCSMKCMASVDTTCEVLDGSCDGQFDLRLISNQGSGEEL